MFGLMKGLLKEKETPEAVRLADLHVGCVVGFGFMPQGSLSGRRLPVTEVNSYIFEDDHFVAYRLENEDTDINLIVADGSEEQGAYLALSQRLNRRLYGPLFISPLPENWFDLKVGDSIGVSTHVLGAPQGWLTVRYTLAMKTEGRFLEGDYRLRSPVGRLKLSRPFEYVLLVDDANNYALEAERYEDGTLSVFATVYRPATDIGEIGRSLKPRMPSRPVFEEDDEAAFMALASAPPEPMLSQRVPEDDIIEIAASLPPPPVAMPDDLAPVHGKFGRLQQPASTATAAVPETLAFDTRLAGRIIDEAQRNQMLISELIRKVIDLPARIQEEVLIPFELSDAEYGELARRYGLQADDRDGVRARILEELRQFTGDKKK